MSTTDDWQEARREALKEGQRRVGPPPPVEKVEALLRGELPPEEAQHVLKVLAYYPELLHVMTVPEAGDETPVLTDAQREEDFNRICGRSAAAVIAMSPPKRESVRFIAIAAGIVVAAMIGGVVLMQRWQREPRELTRKVLIADGVRSARGGSTAHPVVLVADTTYLLKPLHRPSREYRGYRLELLDMGATPHRSVWKQDDVERHADGSFPAELSTDDLAPGDYELVLYGVSGEAEHLATYTLRIEAP